MSTSTSLWHGRHFLPLWFSQFFSALNDNLFRYGLNAALIFGVIKIPKQEGELIVSLSAAIFILPYLIISGISGQLADKLSKSTLLRWNRGFEIFVFGLSAFALMQGNVPLLLICLTLVGALAAFYGPVKLAITPELVAEENLIAANGAIEAGTYAAILIGTLVGTQVMANKSGGPILAVSLIMSVAAIAWIFSLLTPNTPPAAPNLKLDWNVPKQTWSLITWGAKDRQITTLMFGNGWFWFVGTAVLSQLTLFVKDDLHGVPGLNTVLLALFAVGIGLGAWFCNWLLKGQISLRFSSVSAFGMAFWSLLLAGLAYCHTSHSGNPLTIAEFIGQKWCWMLMLSVVMLAVNAGLFVVPFVTMMQTCVADDQRARMLSLSNIWFAVFIIAGAIMSALIIKLGGEPKTIFAVAGFLSLIVSWQLWKSMTKESIKGLFSVLLRLLYRVDVNGIENLTTAGNAAVIVANHQSLIDGLLLAVFLPGDPVFAIDPIAASRWWAKPLVSLVDIATLNPLQPMSVRHLIQTVQSGRHCIIFPEGRLTTTGGLMKIYAGPAMIASKSMAPIVPVGIDGAQYTGFSYLKGTLPIRLFPKVTITVLPQMSTPDIGNLTGSLRRAAMTRNLYDVMADMMLASQSLPDTLWMALLDASRLYGKSTEVLEDAKRNPVTYQKLLLSANTLGLALKKKTSVREHVGILLPTGIPSVATFFGLLSIGRVPAMVNFTAGIPSVTASLASAQVKTIVTAREFIQKAKLGNLINSFGDTISIVYLEDLRQQISLTQKISALVMSSVLHQSAESKAVNPDDPAVILFTSGSEGTPKGVALSHKNLLSNVQQIRTVIAYNPQDIIFNALPVFHAFGLTGGMLVPILHGLRAFLHVTPLQYRVVPELIYHSGATLFFGTDTFLTGYAKAADNYDLYKVRLIVSGAEPLRQATVKVYAERFGVPVYEGYGVTECSPAISLNTPMYHKPGTVGRLLPGITYKLEAEPGLSDGQRLWVHGPNIMEGYYKADAPGTLQRPDGGWYDTGDIVSIDNEGYIKILGRAKRFAKIGGEMVSLAAVENYAVACWPNAQHAVVTAPDHKKGEALILVTTAKDATLAVLVNTMRAQGAPELSMPKSLRILSSLPMLGSGKPDFVTLKAQISDLTPV